MTKALEVKTPTVFNLVFPSNAILFCFFFFALIIIDWCFLTFAFIIQIFIVATELAIPTDIPIKEAKAEMKTWPVTVDAKIDKCLV